jgi:hypothetical protein
VLIHTRRLAARLWADFVTDRTTGDASPLVPAGRVRDAFHRRLHSAIDR